MSDSFFSVIAKYNRIPAYQIPSLPIRELSRVLEARVSGVQQALRSLEVDGLVASRPLGPTKLYRVDPDYFAYDELQRYLLRLAEPERALRRRIESKRRQPPRSGRRV